MGRKPDPTALKLVKGNPGKRPLNDKEPRLETRIPPCPKYLEGEARKEWRRITKQLQINHLITEADRSLLAAYCQAYKIWVDATEKVNKHGTVIKAPSGFPVQSPFVSIANKQVEIMIKLASEFGMSPASRTRIKVEKPPEEDPMEALISGTA